MAKAKAKRKVQDTYLPDTIYFPNNRDSFDDGSSFTLDEEDTEFLEELLDGEDEVQIVEYKKVKVRTIKKTIIVE